MDGWAKRSITIALASVMLFSLGLVTACSGDSVEDEPADAEAAQTEQESDADAEETTMDDDVDDAELRDGALDTAQGWFVGPGSDFGTDEVEFEIATMLQSEDGSWWARVTATPNDASMESEQVYVTLPSGMTLWQPIDSGTGITPATDDRFPEDIRDQL